MELSKKDWWEMKLFTGKKDGVKQYIDVFANTKTNEIYEPFNRHGEYEGHSGSPPYKSPIVKTSSKYEENYGKIKWHEKD